MLKNILKLDGTQQLSTKEQKAINGGIRADQCFANLDPATCASVGGVYRGVINGVHKCLVTRVPEEEGYQYIGCN
ncbi:hypothetical protein [Flavobacterium urocaniciphilum]|uniref:Uncharacterized protein n=1 Tax=Flavobacterium urocaniciphilum TaxID=1299341 RepID=A0A1H9DUN1_9FLAO|nr:hypothetical protein [Flavobacterium urocaniciphilum]SEQ17017.1 hypothetical protein SAMN05444005_10872 [Flavobacterium urocaniciphilum]